VCKESATADDVRAAMPHPVVGSAADPIAVIGPVRQNGATPAERALTRRSRLW